MTFQRAFAIWCRFSLLWVLAVGGFWSVWFLCTGSVPSGASFTFLPNLLLPPLHGVSRAVDVIIGPLYAALLTPMITTASFQKLWKMKDFPSLFLAGMLFVSLFGLIKDKGVMSMLSTGMLFGFVNSVAFGPMGSLVIGSCCALMGGLVAGLTYGSAYGAAFGLVAGASIAVAGTVFSSTIFLCSKEPWCRFGAWIAAKDKVT